MFLDGNPQDTEKAKAWVAAMKRDQANKHRAIAVEDGKLHHGYTTNDKELDQLKKVAHARREINDGKKYADIAALASFSPYAIRQYAARIGIPTAEMYRNPVHLKAMVKDSDYAKFRLNTNAANML
tara:strand:+ start:208 stop:585 length:378 start_codon:yes stop_codon:yes gene_type:complete